MSKRILITLQPDEYRALERLAEKAERDPWQQARFFIRCALADNTSATPTAPSDNAGRPQACQAVPQ